MKGKKEPGTSWRHTSVVIRADIFSMAYKQGIDISNICNKALADLLSVDYHQQQLDDMPVTRPVIIAENEHLSEEIMNAPGTHLENHSPVINADDPNASATVRSTKNKPKITPPAKEVNRVQKPHQKKDEGVQSPAAKTSHSGKALKPVAGKTSKENGLKKFVSIGIIRSDAADAVCSKDDMYLAFTRFCKDHELAPIPDRKTFTIALKNKFAFFDKTINGIPSWVNVRLK